MTNHDNTGNPVPLHKIGKEREIGLMTKLRYAKIICFAMELLHKSKVLHLRLKPSNILFTNWEIKLIDYGLDLPPLPNIPEDWIKSGHAYFYPPELLSDPTKKSSAVDVYSFGMVLYSFLSEEFPYTEAKTIDQLKKCIEEQPVQLDPSLYPPSIINLIKSCLNKNPSNRPNFAKLTDSWKMIYYELVSAGIEKGQAIWKLAAKQKVVKEIPWNEFSPVLWQEFGIDYPDPLQVECVKTMLFLEDSMVLHRNWMNFLMWFSPLRTGKEEKEYFDKVVQLLQAPWFYGIIDRVHADSLLYKNLENRSAMEKNNGKFPFLVRIVINQQYKFCLVCINDSQKISHHLFSPDDYVDIGIYQYCIDFAERKNLFGITEHRPIDTYLSKVVQIKNTTLEMLCVTFSVLPKELRKLIVQKMVFICQEDYFSLEYFGKIV